MTQITYKQALKEIVRLRKEYDILWKDRKNILSKYRNLQLLYDKLHKKVKHNEKME